MTEAKPQPPFLTIEKEADQLRVKTNIPPQNRPLMLWFLEEAKLMILTQKSDQEQSKVALTLPTNGLLRKMGFGK